MVAFLCTVVVFPRPRKGEMPVGPGSCPQGAKGTDSLKKGEKSNTFMERGETKPPPRKGYHPRLNSGGGLISCTAGSSLIVKR